MAFCMTFSSYFLHKIHIAKIKTNLALFLDHYNLKGWPRLGVDGGKESWFRADVLFLCNRRFKHQRKISESLRPQTAPLRVCCFVLFFWQSSSFPQQPHPHSRPQEKRQLWILANEKSCRESSSELGVNLPSSLATGGGQQRGHTSSILLPLSSCTLLNPRSPEDPRRDIPNPWRGTVACLSLYSSLCPGSWHTIWVLKNVGWISGNDHSTFWFWLN